MQRWLLWVAQGFGLGRLPVAPGTFGSLAGLLWVAVLLRAGQAWIYVTGTVLGLALAVWLCGLAEKTLRQTDPASVVLDEIVVFPICFLPLVGAEWLRTGTLPNPEVFFGSHSWHLSAVIFILFRLFDIAKPWPVRSSQRLPGGWGVVCDDVLAAVYVALLLWVVVV